MKIPSSPPLIVSLRWRADDVLRVGRLAVRNRRTFFQYDPSFVERALPLSPFHLAVAEHVLGPFDTPFEGLPGVFNDGLPDGWGRLLVDRRARRLGVALTPLDRLAIVGRHGIGALAYEPETELDAGPAGLDLDALAEDTAATLHGAPPEGGATLHGATLHGATLHGVAPEGGAAGVIDRLIVIGGSPQGARPKAMIGWSEAGGRIVHGAGGLAPGFRHFLLKFPAQSDPKDIGPIEFAYSSMARAAGLRIPRTHLFPSRKGPGFFGAERFDHAGPDRYHVHTLSGLLHTDHRTAALDYTTVLTATQRLTRNHQEVLAMFRLMAFNVAARNRDDHAKQFSVLMDRHGEWRMSPAYDLTFSDGVNGEHTTTVDGEGHNPSDADMHRVADKIGIKKSAATEIIETVRAAVAKWPAFADEAGVTKTSAREIERAINPSAKRR